MRWHRFLSAIALAAAPRATRAEEPEPPRVRARLIERPETGTRPPPTLRPDGSGGYEYDGEGFRAHIGADGTLRTEDESLFRDLGLQFGRGLSSDETAGTEEPTPLFLSLAVRFDLTEMVLKLIGDDPHASQRLWLARETEALRDQLADRARAADIERALGDLQTRLRVIWRDLRRPTADRCAAIRELLDECADDEVGARARAIIEDFVRETLPEDAAASLLP